MVNTNKVSLISTNTLRSVVNISKGMTAIELSICCFETYSTSCQKLKITCFCVLSSLEYGIHLYEYLAMQPFYMQYNIEEYYDRRRSISVRNVHMSLYILKTLKMLFKTLLLQGYQCLSSMLKPNGCRI